MSNKQVLIIEPQNELRFKGLFEQGLTTYMRLTNPTNDTVLFKVKTTAPKKYCVRPNSGVLEPNKKVEIAITPQPVYVDPNEKHKHKFMVQSMVAPESYTSTEEAWAQCRDFKLIMDYKLKCVFDTPPNADGANDAGDTDARKKVVTANDTKNTAKDAVEGFIQNEAKRKADGDDAAGGAKATAFPKGDNTESELKKATLEVVQLREEESQLRHENLKLKEELRRLRQSSGHAFTPEKTQQAPMLPWLGIAFAMAFLGILIGKYFM